MNGPNTEDVVGVPRRTNILLLLVPLRYSSTFVSTKNYYLFPQCINTNLSCTQVVCRPLLPLLKSTHCHKSDSIDYIYTAPHSLGLKSTLFQSHECHLYNKLKLKIKIKTMLLKQLCPQNFIKQLYKTWFISLILTTSYFITFISTIFPTVTLVIIRVLLTI